MSPAYPKPAPRKRAEPEPVPEGARLAVEARSGGLCEGCGLVRATEIHHRKFRSRGGTNDVENLLHLCGWGNTSGCHGAAHGGPPTSERFSAIGWAVAKWKDPLHVSLIYRGEPLYLTADGLKITPEQYESENT